MDGHYQQYHGDEDAFSDDPTPVPSSYRPPPPTSQQQQQYPEGATSASHQGLLNSTLLSFSVDGTTGGMETLPSLSLPQPPSPLSRPSDSLLMALSSNTSEGKQSHDQGAATTSSPTRSNLSMARQRQQQHSNSESNFPPIQEVLVDDQAAAPGDIGGSSERTQDDTFFECIEDRSLAQRTKRTLQHATTPPRQDASRSNSHIQRNMLASPDTAQPRMPSTRVNTQAATSHDNNNNNISLMSSFSAASSQHQHQQRHLSSVPPQTGQSHATNISSDEVVRVHESALQALQHLKEELVKSNQRNDQLTQQHQDWQQEQQQLKQQLQQLQQKSQDDDSQLETLHQDFSKLQSEHSSLLTSQQTWTKQKLDLESQLREANRSNKELRHRTLAADNRHKELKSQLDKLNGDLEQTLAGKGDLSTEVAHLQTQHVALQTEIAELKARLADVTLERDQGLEQVEKLEDQLDGQQEKMEEIKSHAEKEVDRLNKSLRKANETMHKMKAELMAKARLARNIASSPQFFGNNNINGNTAHPDTPMPASLDTAIADRLARLRDSAERAHLIRGHKRELAKIKADKDAAIQALEAEHADALKKLAKQQETKRISQVEEVTQRLQQQYETKIEEIEEAHRKKMAQLQKDRSKLQEELDESLQEALSRVARVTQDYERESLRRAMLEKNMQELQQQIQVEKKEWQSRYAEELERRQHDWESERDTIMVTLQKDVNSAFDSKRRNWKGTHTPRATGSPRYYGQGVPPLSTQQPNQPPRPSPLSMNSAIFFQEKSTVDSPSPRAAYIVPSPTRQSPHSETGGGGGPPSMISQSYSDIDSVLRETEELVQSVL